MHLLLRNGMVLLPGPRGFDLRQVDVVLEDGRIAEVVSSSPVHPRARGRVLDASRRLIIPGLINAHTHSWANVLAGLADGLPLEPWLALMSAWLTGRTPRETYVSALVGGMQMLKSGVTAALDHFRTGTSVDPEHAESLFQAYEVLGIRACVGLNVMDRRLIEILPLHDMRVPAAVVRHLERQQMPPARQQLQDVQSIIEAWHGRQDGRLTCALAPSGPHRCSDELLEACARLKRQLGLGLHTHLLETRFEAAIGLRLYGESPVAHLDRLGLLDPRTSLAHAVWLAEQDIERLAATGASVVHNPASNLKLGSGVAPVPRLHRRGVPIGLGSDGASCNDSQQIFESMKLAVILHRPGADAAEWLDASTVFNMATGGGARALCAADELGTIALGRRADLVLLDLDSIFLTPNNNLLDQLVFCENGASVDAVVVDGQIVVRGGIVQGVDERAIQGEAEALRPGMLERTRAAREEAESLLPVLKEAVRWAQQQPLEPSHGGRPSWEPLPSGPRGRGA